MIDAQGNDAIDETNTIVKIPFLDFACLCIENLLSICMMSSVHTYDTKAKTLICLLEININHQFVGYMLARLYP